MFAHGADGSAAARERRRAPRGALRNVGVAARYFESTTIVLTVAVTPDSTSMTTW
jgi:hypothetical protein